MALRGAAGRDAGTNLARVKDYNEAVVLGQVRAGAPIGRAAIAAATGLTLQTVSNIARRLLASGLLTEEASAVGGRERRVLRLAPDAAHALGIHLVRTKLIVGVVDLDGSVRARAETSLTHDEPPEAVIARLAELVEQALAEAGLTRDELLGAGIGAPGPLDLRAGRLLNVLSPASWSGFPMRRAVEDALDMRVILDNDASAAAMGERWSGAGAGCDDLVYVYLGDGLGTGLILGGQPYRGLRGNAGEVSHVQVDPSGPVCDCGRRGCLGLYPTRAGLVREAQRTRLEAPPNQPVTDALETLDDVMASRDPRVVAVVDQAGERLAGVMAAMARVLDPELIVLGGPLLPLVGDRFAAAIGRRLEQLGEPGAPPPRLERSRIGSDAGVIGAATLVLHDLYAPSARKLSLAQSEAGRRAA